ncbi:MAG: YeeE/YedE family protein [Rhodobacter sp. CACIA14H1]|nr:MAG: YeeE/YedE family protein [Rhodobacter sp. CACIA14H1]
MRRNLSAFLCGALFGAGLLLSGMTDTTRVQGWLDVFGDWDATLAFVMGGAILPMAAAWIVARRRRTALLGTPLPLEQDATVDAKLVLGSTLFGAGWALAGLCPGPALASLGYGGTGGMLFLIAMLAGMVAAPAAKARLDHMTARG